MAPSSFPLAVTLFKLALVSIPAFFAVLVLTPPKRAPQSKGPIYKGMLFEHVVRYVSGSGSMLIVGIAIGHAVMLLSHHPQGKALRPVLPLICPTPSSSLETLTAFTPRFIVGVAFALAGGLFRWVAMRKLGGLFTYEVVIKDDHQLVASGPYSIVRHPGYTGVLLLLIGVHLSLWDDAGYISQCNLSYTPQFMFMPMLSTFAVVNLARRCSGEDAQLRSHFGETWEKYRAQVPYCMIPYMY